MARENKKPFGQGGGSIRAQENGHAHVGHNHLHAVPVKQPNWIPDVAELEQCVGDGSRRTPRRFSPCG